MRTTHKRFLKTCIQQQHRLAFCSNLNSFYWAFKPLSNFVKWITGKWLQSSQEFNVGRVKDNHRLDGYDRTAKMYRLILTIASCKCFNTHLFFVGATISETDIIVHENACTV